MTANYHRCPEDSPWCTWSKCIIPTNEMLWAEKSRLLKMLGKWKKDGEGRWMRYRYMESGNEYKLMIKWDPDYRVWTTLHGKKTFKSREAAMKAEETYGRRKGFILMEMAK